MRPIGFTWTCWVRRWVGRQNGGSTLTFGSIQTAYSQGAFNPQVIFDAATGRIVLAFGRTANDNPMVQIGSYNTGTGVVDWGTAQSIQAEAHLGPLECVRLHLLQGSMLFSEDKPIMISVREV